MPGPDDVQTQRAINHSINHYQSFHQSQPPPPPAHLGDHAQLQPFCACVSRRGQQPTPARFTSLFDTHLLELRARPTHCTTAQSTPPYPDPLLSHRTRCKIASSPSSSSITSVANANNKQRPPYTLQPVRPPSPYLSTPDRPGLRWLPKKTSLHLGLVAGLLLVGGCHVLASWPPRTRL